MFNKLDSAISLKGDLYSGWENIASFKIRCMSGRNSFRAEALWQILKKGVNSAIWGGDDFSLSISPANISFDDSETISEYVISNTS